MRSGGNNPKFIAYQTVRIGGAPDYPSPIVGICNREGSGAVFCGEGGEDRLLRAEAGSGAEALVTLGRKLKEVCAGTDKSCEPLGEPRVEVPVVMATRFAKWFGDLIHPWIK